MRPDKEVGTRPRLIIKNYRLQVVKDEAVDLGPEVLRLGTENRGTCIPTFNSVIRPEVHSFGTKVTDKLAQAWPELLGDDGRPMPEPRGQKT